MDDLKLLRDLGRELEHEPPATLARQRNRLYESRPRRRMRGWMLVSLAAAATALAVVLPTVLLAGRQPAAPPDAATRPVSVAGTVNILVVGSDHRPSAINSDPGSRSDTMMIVHMAEDRKRVSVINLPRDSMVRVPECRTPKGVIPARTDMINSAFNSGMACAVSTVESLTKIRIDHTVELDFTALKDVVDALGGVEVTLKQPVNDPKAKFNMPAGTHLLNGEQALGYVRLRSGIGDGSDLSRIKRQQTFMKAMLKKAKTLAGDSARFRLFLSEVDRAVKTDDALNVETMFALAVSADRSGMAFQTVPVEAYSKDRNRLQWKQPEAEKLFAQFR